MATCLCDGRPSLRSGLRALCLRLERRLRRECAPPAPGRLTGPIALAGHAAMTAEEPTEDEVVAAVAAIEVAWPRAAVAAADAAPRWRFAGRWWSKPVLARRERPW